MSQAAFHFAEQAKPTGKRGRGATSVRERIDQRPRKNPCGRHTLTFRFRPLKKWEETEIAAAERLATLYFDKIGAFRIADDATIRAIITALGEYSERYLVFAINAKAQSLEADWTGTADDKRKFATPPDQFFQINRIEKWLAAHPQFQAESEKIREADRQQAEADRKATAAAALAERDRQLRAADDARRAQRRQLEEKQRAAVTRSKKEHDTALDLLWQELSAVDRDRASRANDGGEFPLEQARQRAMLQHGDRFLTILQRIRKGDLNGE